MKRGTFFVLTAILLVVLALCFIQLNNSYIVMNTVYSGIITEMNMENQGSPYITVNNEKQWIEMWDMDLFINYVIIGDSVVKRRGQYDIEV
jgi:hypothetical protein